MKLPCVNALVISSCFLLQPLLMSISSPAMADGLPNPGIPQSCGVNIHYRPIPDDVLPHLGDTGYGYARTDFKWNQIESTPGVYDFSIWDKMTAELASIGCKPLYVIDYGNPIYDPDADVHAKINGPFAPPRTPEALAAYARFAAAAVAHFHGEGVIWEIWNEPDGNTFWKPSPSAQEYAAMAFAAAKAMRAADPGATIIAPGLGGAKFDYLKPAFQLGLLKFVDAVSWHPYRHSYPETVKSQFESLHKLIAQYTVPGDPVRPIVASEWGYATTVKWNVDQAEQGRYLVREWLGDLALGVDLTIYYDWRDDGKDAVDQEQNFGTLHNDFSPKPAGSAAKSLIGGLSGYAFEHRLATASPDDWRLLFRKDYSLAVVIWSTASTASDVDATPSIRIVSPNDPDYHDLLRAASIGYHAGLYAFTALAPAKPQITVTNPELRTATVDISIGNSDTTLNLAPGETKSVSMNPFTGMTPGQNLTAPVNVVWNGTKVTALPPIDAAETDLVGFSLDPRSDGFTLKAESYVLPFHGAFEIATSAGKQRVPIDLDSYQTTTLFIRGNPETTVQVSAFDEKNRLIAQSEKERYVLIAGMPRSLADPSAFFVQPCPMNAPTGGAPAKVVPAGDGAPSPYAIEFPYGTAPTWLYTLLRPTLTSQIPDSATEIVVWIKSTQDKCTMCSRYVDSTKQTFQPSLGAMDYEGWRAQHFSLREQSYSFGGASDGIQHLPLRLDSLISVEGTRHPTGNNTALIDPGYYVIDEGK